MKSAVRYRVGGQEYPMISVPQCHTCQSEYRSYIENAIIMGHGFTSIARGLPGGADLPKEEIHRRALAIRRHYDKGHMPIPEASRRRLIESRAMATSKDSDVENLIDPWVVANVGMNKAFELMMQGQITPDIKDLINFTKLVLEIDDRASGENGITSQSVIRLIKEAGKRMSATNYAEFMEIIADNPEMGILNPSKVNTDPKELEAPSYDSLPDMGDEATVALP